VEKASASGHEKYLRVRNAPIVAKTARMHKHQDAIASHRNQRVMASTLRRRAIPAAAMIADAIAARVPTNPPKYSETGHATMPRIVRAREMGLYSSWDDV
jgi:hypothetical protein